MLETWIYEYLLILFGLYDIGFLYDICNVEKCIFKKVFNIKKHYHITH